MNYDQITGVLRAAIPAFISFAAGAHWFDVSTSTDAITAAAIAIAAMVWSILNNKTGKVIK